MSCTTVRGVAKRLTKNCEKSAARNIVRQKLHDVFLGTSSRGLADFRPRSSVSPCSCGIHFRPYSAGFTRPVGYHWRREWGHRV